MPVYPNSLPLPSKFLSMLFAIGSPVRFRYTGETGIIVAKLADDMLSVRLDSDPSLEIPAFEEDLIRNEAAEPALPGARFIQGKKEKAPEAPPRRTMNLQYEILKPKGVQLAFEPMPGRDGIVTRYKVWLLNDTKFEFLIEFDFFTDARDVIVLDDKLNACAALELGDMVYDDLNESPEVWLSLRRITTEGSDEALEKKLKIKPKSFFNHLQTAPILNCPAYLFLMVDKFEPQQESTPRADVDLKAYTRQHARQRRSAPDNNVRPVKPHNVEEFATFIPEIDLHIQNLNSGYARLDKGEILRIQLLHFQRFLDKAISLGVPRIFVIHGVGEGKLRDAIAQRLRENPQVVKFKNEYHHKYGYGATEVVLA